MPKRFIDPDWKKLRVLPGYMQRAWFYVWDKADECGVYYHDQEYFKLDLRLETEVSIQQLSELPEFEILPGDRILIKNFLFVNYTKLKPDYNPHKPAFRAIERNGLCLNPSLNQAYLKLEEEDKEEDEGKKEGGKEETIPTIDPETLVPTMVKKFMEVNPAYPYDQLSDFSAIRLIAEKISKWLGQSGQSTDNQNRAMILKRWGELVGHIKTHSFFSELSLTQLNKQFQSVVQSLNGNGSNRNKNRQNGSHRTVITGDSESAGTFE